MNKIVMQLFAFLTITFATQAQDVFYNNGSLVHINTGCLVKINGNLTNTAGSTLSNNGTVTVTGNTINNQVFTVPNNGTLEFTGNTTQTLNGTTAYFAKNVLINNAAGVTLNSPLKADGTVTFTNGIVTAATTTPFVFTNNATVTGAADASHVNGYVVKEGTGNFTYPVGNGTKYQPCATNLTANATGMQVKYNATDAGAGAFLNSGTETTALVSYNTQEHWDISPLSTATGTVTIYWDGYNDAFGNVLSQRKVAHKTGSNWLNEGTTATGTIAVGSVTSNAINTWSPFALGSIGNVLPLSWLNVSGNLNNSKQPVLSFKVNETNVVKYEIEKSNDGRTFIVIATISSKGNGENTYQFIEAAELNGTSLYRIKQTDINGKFSYSTIVRLSVNNKEVINIYPNPVKDIVTISGVQVGSTLTLIDISGKILKQVMATTATFTIDMSPYNSGLYLIKSNSGNAVKIIKH